MRNSLWPSPLAEHVNDIERFFAGTAIDIVEVFVLERNDGNLGGFIEINVRNFAEGSRSAEVPYIEAWYIDADLRGRGYGRSLIEFAEKWSRLHGFEELASDTDLENENSIAAHKALGFVEVERVVCFIKKLV